MTDDRKDQHLPAIDSRTTLFDKISSERRRALDRAIVDHDPPTYRGIFTKFRLADAGVNFYAFYRYARKIRLGADVLHLAELTGPEDADLPAILPTLLAQRLLDTVLDPDASPRAVHRLADAYRIATATHLANERFAATVEADKKTVRRKEVDDLCNLVRNYAKVREGELKTEAAQIQAAQAHATVNPNGKTS